MSEISDIPGSFDTIAFAFAEMTQRYAAEHPSRILLLRDGNRPQASVVKDEEHLVVQLDKVGETWKSLLAYREPFASTGFRNLNEDEKRFLAQSFMHNLHVRGAKSFVVGQTVESINFLLDNLSYSERSAFVGYLACFYDGNPIETGSEFSDPVGVLLDQYRWTEPVYHAAKKVHSRSIIISIDALFAKSVEEKNGNHFIKYIPRPGAFAFLEGLKHGNKVHLYTSLTSEDIARLMGAFPQFKIVFFDCDEEISAEKINEHEQIISLKKHSEAMKAYLEAISRGKVYLSEQDLILIRWMVNHPRVLLDLRHPLVSRPYLKFNFDIVLDASPVLADLYEELEDPNLRLLLVSGRQLTTDEAMAEAALRLSSEHLIPPGVTRLASSLPPLPFRSVEAFHPVAGRLPSIRIDDSVEIEQRREDRAAITHAATGLHRRASTIAKKVSDLRKRIQRSPNRPVLLK